MKYKLGKNEAFTLIELLVALGILVIVMAFSGVIFKVSIDSQRIAIANAEIMQKFRAITGQLNSDFRGLDKDGEIFVVWQAAPVRNNAYNDSDLDGYERFDRIMFFAEGDFQSYTHEYLNNDTDLPSMSAAMVCGNMARICYTMAKSGTTGPGGIDREKRILARTQHILTDDQELDDYFDPNNFTDAQWFEWNNYYVYDKISLEQWKLFPFEHKIDMLSVICDTDILGSDSLATSVNKDFRGVSIDLSDPNTMHMLLCEGVSEFKIQGWDNDLKTWMPEVDPDGNGDLADSHFFWDDTDHVPGALYSWPVSGLNINNISYPSEEINREHFNSIPGLGRALKFTFTIFDSKGIIEGGRTFSHIVYLDN